MRKKIEINSEEAREYQRIQRRNEETIRFRKRYKKLKTMIPKKYFDAAERLARQYVREQRNAAKGNRTPETRN